MTETKSTCCYCGVGCGVIIQSEGERITGVRGDPDHPANFGRLCSKGATLHLTSLPQTRALYPELRSERLLPRQRVGWDAALDKAAEKFAAVIKEHGPNAVAFYISGQLLTEDYYVFNKLAKGLVGTNNLDSNSRLCMSSAVVAYKQTLGADAPPTCYEDIAHTDCLLISGANPAYAHPIVFRRIEDAKAANPDLKIIVVDPRRTDTAACADLHLPILPGTDIVLFNAMLNVLLWEGMVDNRFIREHTEGFEILRDAVRETTPAVAAAICGVPAEDIIAAARWFGSAKAALSMWCQGLNQSAHGSLNGAALIHLHLATGQIGRPGAGPFSLTGQPNAMGGREVGAMANLLSGHRDMANAEHRAEIASFWQVPDVPATPGKTAVELFDAIGSGEIKAVWIACTNPAQSLPDLGKVREALAQAEFVVLQEAYATTETADFADLLLPAIGWGEKEGTVTNSERRITHVRPAVSGPGEARADWHIATDFARRLSTALGRRDGEQLFPYTCPEDVFREHAASTVGRDLDIGGLSYWVLDSAGPQQWPMRQDAAQGTQRLYSDSHFATANGRARFVPLPHQINAETTDARYPLHLNTGRLRDQWHGMSRTGKVARLFSHVEEARLDMHPDDLARRSLKDEDFVSVKSRRGEIIVRVRASEDVRRGQVFMAMHWGRRYLNHDGVNALTIAAFDPSSKQPELKHAAVQVAKVELPWHGLVLRGETIAENQADHAGRVLEWLAAVQPLLSRFRYASLALLGRERPALQLRLAHDGPVPAQWLADIDAALGLADDQCLSYRDARRGVDKKALVLDGVLVGVRLIGEVAAGAWLRQAVLERMPAAEIRRWLLAPVASLPTGHGPRRGRIVCNCLDVSEDEIIAEAVTGVSLEGLQSKLKCGTSCGSCVPELKRLLSAHQKAA